MTVGCRANVSLPFPTKAGDHTKYTKRLTCVDPYQTLPYHTLAERNPLVVLVWWCHGLPGLTSLPIWLYTCRVSQRGEGYRSIERWHSVAQHGEPYTPSEVGHTVVVGVGKKKEKNLTMVA